MADGAIPETRASVHLPESVDPTAHVMATYAIRVDAGADIDTVANDLAETQSSGTWVTVSREDRVVRDRHAARVVGIWGVPDLEMEDAGRRRRRDWVVRIAYPAYNIGTQIPLLLATVLGEGASMGEIRLIDLELPGSFVDAFPGPRLGVEGIRDIVDAHGRPLLVTIVKPALGLSPAESAALFREAALGGSDAVKDDELLVDHPWSTVDDRVRAHAEAARVVFEETGRRTLYFVNITDRPDRTVERARRAVDAGASALMVDFVTVGMATLGALADDPSIGVPILGHLAMAGALSAAPRTGMSSHLVLGKLPRLAGADAVVVPSPVGTLRTSRRKLRGLAATLTGRFRAIRPALPVVGGGVHPGIVGGLIADLGTDVAIGVGGAVHGHPMGTEAGARAMRQAIDAIVAGESLASAGERQPELGAALRAWAPDLLVGS
jgi:2,3-diketo-5-methylthiopentyl-1-phosphate enolase